MTENEVTSSSAAQQITEQGTVDQSTPTAGFIPSTTGKPPVDRKKYVIVIGGILATGLLLFGFLYFRSLQPTDETPATPTPTVVPTPTPTPNVSRIATTSAFRSFSEEVASFSATLNSFTLQDSTLAPPILDLDLGLNE